MHATGKSREFVLAHPEYVLSEKEYTDTIDFLRRRMTHEPIAYIVGHKEFYGLDFMVNQYTLIPRPETELMVEMALARSKKYGVRSTENARFTIIDIGTGSGNIIVTLATLLRGKNIDTTLFGLDISRDALLVEKENAQRHGVEHEITFLQSDLLEAFSHGVIPGLTRDPGLYSNTTQPESPITSGMIIHKNSYSHILILANLPYLSEEIYQSAEADVKDFEPITALVSNEAGLAHYRKLLEQVTRLRSTEVFSYNIPLVMIFEISPEQHDAIEILITEFFPNADISVIKDYSQRFRFVKIGLLSEQEN